MEVTEVGPGVHHARAKHVSWALVVDGSSLTLVDTGYPRDRERLFRSVELVGRRPSDVDAVVLCGTSDTGFMAGMLGGDGPVDLSGLNAPFEHRTGFEWLSRDEAEVDRYMADEACGWVAPNPPGVATMAEAADATRVAGIRRDLPVLIISGDADPIADGGVLVRQVGARYQDAGLTDVTVTLYPQARHELLNETNRDAVTADVVAFFDRTVGA